MTAPDPVRSRWLLLGTVAALLLVFVPLLGPSLLGRSVFVETGVVLRFEPWSSEASVESRQGVTIAHDTVDFYLPRTSEFAERLRDGDLALWEPYAAGGTPLGAVPEAAVLSPLALPALVLPSWLAPAWVRLLTVLVAVGGTSLFLRRLGLARPAALFGGLVYATSGFFVLWNGWPQAQVAAFVPALFWAAERALQERRAAAAVPVALVAAGMLLASFPAVLVHALYLLGPYVLLRVVWPRVPRPLLAGGLVAGGLVLGLCLAAVQVLPFVERLGVLDLGYRQQSSAAHPPVQALLTTLAPYAFGSETELDFFGYRNTVETISYAGVVCVVLAFAAVLLRVRVPVPRGVVGFFAGSVAVIVLVGWVGGPFLALAQTLPLVGDSFIGRIRSVLALCLAVLAAVGAEKVLRLPGAHRPLRPWAVPVAGAALVVGVLAVRAALATAGAADRTDVLVRGLVPAAVVAAVLAALLLLARSGATRGAVALGLLPVLVAAEGLAFMAPRWPSEPRAEFYPRTSVHEHLAGGLEGERFAAARSVMFPSTNIAYRLRAVTGHAFQPPEWKQLVGSIDPAVRQGPTLTFLGEDERTARSPVLDRLAARFFVASVHHPVFGRRESGAVGDRVVAMPDGVELRSALPAGPRRALVLRLGQPLTGGSTGRLTATFTAADGAVLGVVEHPGLTAGMAAPLHVPVVEDGALDRATHVRLRLTGVSAQVAANADGPVLDVVRPTEDGLRLAHAGGSLVYERTTALPRVRWASSMVAEPDPARALALLGSGGLRDDQVVLRSGGPATGGAGAVRVVEDSGDVLRADVRAQGAGWLVVADALQHGWAAYVDGRRTELVPADHAVVAVPVPAGDARVELRYEPPGRRAGLLVSGGALVALVLLGLSGRVTGSSPAGRYRRAPAGRRTALSGRAAVGRRREGLGGDRPE